MLKNIKLVPCINSKEYYISFYTIHECYRKQVNKQAEESCHLLSTGKATCLYICLWLLLGYDDRSIILYKHFADYS